MIERAILEGGPFGGEEVDSPGGTGPRPLRGGGMLEIEFVAFPAAGRVGHVYRPTGRRDAENRIILGYCACGRSS